MKACFLTSGWPNGFTALFAAQLSKFLTNPKRFVLVAADFDNHERTDRHFHQFLRNFKSCGIAFQEAYIVDSRCTPAQANDLIRAADIVLLAGGSPLTQIAAIHQYRLASALQTRDGVTIGVSAGSINMAKRVVLAKDESDGIPQLSIYDGIGLVDLNIEPHLNELSPQHEAEIHQAAQHARIYGLHDEAFVVVANGETTVFGQHSIFECP